MSNSGDFILEFLDAETVSALNDFLNNNDYNASSNKIATAFGYSGNFTSMSDENIKKLVVSFKNNLSLLVQKTWVEKSDIALKDKLLYKLDNFLQTESWKDNYPRLLEIINQAVYLMFGQKTDSPDFAEYTLRIDPEFGIFWWYISSLPKAADWSEEKFRTAMLLGMYFLANY